MQSIKKKPRLSYSSLQDPLLKRAAIGALEYATGRRKLEKIYGRISEGDIDMGVWNKALSGLGIEMVFNRSRLGQIPKTGRLIIIANHPFGVVDGIMMLNLVSMVRADFSILANAALCSDEWLKDFLLPIDFEKGRKAMQTNLRSCNEAKKRLLNNEVIIIFPAGGVSTSKKPFGKAEDLEWKKFIAKLTHETKSPVLPVFFHGQNSRLFQIASQISLNLRLSLLLHEVKNKMGRALSITIGDLILYPHLAKITDHQKLVDHLYHKTFLLEAAHCQKTASYESGFLAT